MSWLQSHKHNSWSADAKPAQTPFFHNFPNQISPSAIDASTKPFFCSKFQGWEKPTLFVLLDAIQNSSPAPAKFQIKLLGWSSFQTFSKASYWKPILLYPTKTCNNLNPPHLSRRGFPIPNPVAFQTDAFNGKPSPKNFSPSQEVTIQPSQPSQPSPYFKAEMHST